MLALPSCVCLSSAELCLIPPGFLPKLGLLCQLQVPAHRKFILQVSFKTVEVNALLLVHPQINTSVLSP